MKSRHISILLLLAACTTPPRTTTAEERAQLAALATTGESLLVIAVAAGRLTPEQHALAMQQVAQLRQDIAASETVPIGWAELMQRATNMAAMWVAARPN